MSDTENDNTPEAIQKQVEERKRLEAEKLAKGDNAADGPGSSSDDDAGGSGSPVGPGGPDRPEITSRYVQDCLYSNELGDGMLFAALHHGKFLYNKASQEWLKWQGHHWELDEMDDALSSVENVSRRYLQEATDIVTQIGKYTEEKGKGDSIKALQKTQTNIYKRVARLRKSEGRVNCLKWAHTNDSNPLAARGDKFDANPWLLGFLNGVLDLRTGKLRDGRPDDLIIKACKTEWHGIDAPAPLWEKTLMEIHQGRKDVVDYIARVFGYAVTGLDIERIFLVFAGLGWNGKGLIVKKIMQIMGDLAAPIPAEMLLDQGRVRSSSGPSPDIMSLRGLRMAFASETDEGRRFSAARVKLLTGADPLTGRYPHDKRPITFDPTHTLFLLTNNEPGAPGGDFAFWKRLWLVLFNLSFIDKDPEDLEENERVRDKYLFDKLEAEGPGIMAWIVRGCLEWQKIGLAPPPFVVEASEKYREREDVLATFLKEFCVINLNDPNLKEGASTLYNKFAEYWEENVSKYVPKQKKFGEWMNKRKFQRRKEGVYYYYGLELLSEEYGQ